MFFLSYFLNILCLLGLPADFVNQTYYGSQQHPDDKFPLTGIQVILLSTSVMYFLVGNTLEYIKRTDFLITVLIGFYGMLKICVRLLF